MCLNGSRPAARWRLGGLALAAALAGCAGVGVKGRHHDIVWPQPPAEPRLIYETTLRSLASVTETSAGERLKRFAKGGQVERSPLVKPYDVAARNGLVVVSDTLARAVFVFDVPRRRLFAIGTRGIGRLYKPLGVAIDDNRDIYVVDDASRRVVVYDAFGHFKRAVGEGGGLVKPSDVAVSRDGKLIYVVDKGGVESDLHRVLIFDREGRQIKAVGTRGGQPGQFNLPLQAALGPDGSLYVLDAGNFRVQVFDAEGNFLRMWGRVGAQLGNLARPRGIAVDAQGHVYVTDAAYQNFQIFNDQGQLLLPVGVPGAPDLPGHFVLPAGIAADETDRIYVVDQLFRKIEVLRLLAESERTGS